MLKDLEIERDLLQKEKAARVLPIAPVNMVLFIPAMYDRVMLLILT